VNSREAVMNPVFFYVTFPDEGSARNTGEKIVLEKLAACCNIISGNALSIYFWKGEIVNDREAVMIVKTTEEKSEKLVNRITELHTYEIPCIVQLSITGGNKDFLNWIKKEVE
jgi:periplasmic divalent cation tolerance protein